MKRMGDRIVTTLIIDKQGNLTLPNGSKDLRLVRTSSFIIPCRYLYADLLLSDE